MIIHCVKYCNSTLFAGVEILRKGAVSAEFRAIGGRDIPALLLPFPGTIFFPRKIGKHRVFSCEQLVSV